MLIYHTQYHNFTTYNNGIGLVWYFLLKQINKLKIRILEIFYLIMSRHCIIMRLIGPNMSKFLH